LHQYLRLETLVREVNFVLSVKFEIALPNFAIRIEPEKPEIEQKALNDMRLLSAETTLAPAQAVRNKGGQYFKQRIFGAVEDTSMTAAFEVKQWRMPDLNDPRLRKRLQCGFPGSCRL